MRIGKLFRSLPVMYGMIVSVIASYGGMAIMFLGTRGWAPSWLTMDMLQDTNAWIVGIWSAVGVLIGKLLIGYGFIKTITEHDNEIS